MLTCDLFATVHYFKVTYIYQLNPNQIVCYESFYKYVSVLRAIISVSFTLLDLTIHLRSGIRIC